MDFDHLAALIEQPETLRRILGNYKGAFSLGLTLNPENRKELAIRVRIEGPNSSDIPREITLDGEKIPVIINTNFEAPVPY